jgi:hypothetical protein
VRLANWELGNRGHHLKKFNNECCTEKKINNESSRAAGHTYYKTCCFPLCTISSVLNSRTKNLFAVVKNVGAIPCTLDIFVKK